MIGARNLPVVVVISVALLLPLVLDAWRIGQLAQYLTYGIFALSLAFIWGQCGMLCFGQAVFFGLGAYAMSVVTLDMVGAPPSSYLGIVAAVLVPAAFANLIGRFLFYGRGLAGAHFAAVTLALGVLAERLASHWDAIGGMNGLMNVPALRLGLAGGGREVFEPVTLYFVMLGAAVAVYAGLEAIGRSALGTAVRAVRDDEERMRSFGYDTARLKLLAFTLSAAVAGLAGALFVVQFNFVSPALIGFALSTEVLIWVAVGGRTMLLAAFLGAILVRSVESTLSERLGTSWLLALGGLFVLTVVLFPRGVIGEVLARLAPFAARKRT